VAEKVTVGLGSHWRHMRHGLSGPGLSTYILDCYN